MAAIIQHMKQTRSMLRVCSHYIERIYLGCLLILNVKGTKFDIFITFHVRFIQCEQALIKAQGVTHSQFIHSHINIQFSQE